LERSVVGSAPGDGRDAHFELTLSCVHYIA